MAVWLAKLEAYAVRTGGAALVGDKLSLADVVAFHTAHDTFADEPATAALFAACPKLSAAIAAVKGHAAVAAYLAARPVTPF